MNDKDKIKFAIRYLKKGLKSKRTPPLYEELMNELGFVKNVKSELCCQRCALPNDLVGSAWCTQHCQHDNRFKRNKEFAEQNDKLNNFASVAEAEDFFKENYPEYVTEKGECLSPYWDLFSAGVICATFELNNEIAELKVYNEKLLNGDIEKHNKIVELKELVEKYRQAVDKCLHITFMGGGCEVNTIGQYATLVDGYLTDVEGLAKWKN